MATYTGLLFYSSMMRAVTKSVKVKKICIAPHRENLALQALSYGSYPAGCKYTINAFTS